MDFWVSDREERISRMLAAAAALIGTGWAIYLATLVPQAVREGAGALVGYVAFFGVGWFVYIGLVRRALGKTSWKDPTVLWWVCIAVNCFWTLLFALALTTPMGIAGFLSAAASIGLSMAGLRVERRRGRSSAL